MLPRLQPARPVAANSIQVGDFFQGANKDLNPGWAESLRPGQQLFIGRMAQAVAASARNRATAINVGLAFAAARHESKNQEDVAAHQENERQYGQVFVLLQVLVAVDNARN